MRETGNFTAVSCRKPRGSDACSWTLQGSRCASACASARAPERGVRWHDAQGQPRGTFSPHNLIPRSGPFAGNPVPGAQVSYGGLGSRLAGRDSAVTLRVVVTQPTATFRHTEASSTSVTQTPSPTSHGPTTAHSPGATPGSAPRPRSPPLHRRGSHAHSGLTRGAPNALRRRGAFPFLALGRDAFPEDERN